MTWTCLASRRAHTREPCCQDHTHTARSPGLHVFLCYLTGFKAHSHVTVNFPDPRVKSKGRKAAPRRWEAGASRSGLGRVERLQLIRVSEPFPAGRLGLLSKQPALPSVVPPNSPSCFPSKSPFQFQVPLPPQPQTGGRCIRPPVAPPQPAAGP